MIATKRKEMRFKALFVFLALFIGFLIIFAMFGNMVAQKSFNLGYAKGVNESCPDLIRQINQNNEQSHIVFYNISLVEKT